MTNRLLNSLSEVCQTYRYVVYNQHLNNGKGGFERAGRCHAIASFFGTPNAKAANRLTLTKIKEALAAEEVEGRRSRGALAAVSGLFAAVDGNKRISSNTVNQIIDSFRQGAKSDPAVLESRKKEFVENMLNGETLSPLAPLSIDAHITGMGNLLKGYEGGMNVLKIMAECCLDRDISGLDVEKAVESLQDAKIKRRLVAEICNSFVNFIMDISKAGSTAKADFIFIFKMVNEKRHDHYSKIVGSELRRIFDAWMDADDKRDFNVAERLSRLCGVLRASDQIQSRIFERKDMLPVGEAYEMVSRLSRINLLDFADEQLRDLSTLSWDEMDRMNVIADFEIDGGTSAEDLYANIMTNGTVLRRLIAYPELSDRAVTYWRAVKLMETFDRKLDELIGKEGLQNVKASTKWILERFVFQDLACRIKSEGALPDVRSFSDGLTLENRFIRFAERFFGRPVIVWNMLCLPPEQRVPVMAAMEAYGEFYNPYLFTRIVANAERIGRIYNEECSSGGAMTKEQVFRAINGDGVDFHPLLHGNAEYWTVAFDRECTWVVNEKAVSLDFEANRYSRKSCMVNDFIQRYALSKEYVMGMAFQEGTEGKSSFRYTEFSPRNAPIVVNSIDGGIAQAIRQLRNDLTRMRPGRFEVKFIMPEGDVRFSKTDGTVENTESVVQGIIEEIMRMCGTMHPVQAENVIMAFTQSLDLDLFAAFASLECDPVNVNGGVSKSFEVTKNKQNGAVSVHVTDMGNSAVSYDWNLTIRTDGIQEVSDLVFSRNHSIDAPWRKNE